MTTQKHPTLSFNSYRLLKKPFAISGFPAIRIAARQFIALMIVILWFSNTIALALPGATSENRINGKHSATPEPFPGKPTNFQGFPLFTISVGHDKATIRCPANPAEGRPWVLAPSSYELKSAPVAYIAQTELDLVKSEKEALAYHKNPVDLARKLAASKVAMIYVAGETDDAVPCSNNGALKEQQNKKSGGTFQLILKKGEGHHPHGLPDQTPIIDFIQLYAGHPIQ